MDTGVLVWNGNGTSGRDAIGKFILELPVSEHKVTSLDAQQILGNDRLFDLRNLVSSCIILFSDIVDKIKYTSMFITNRS